ALPTGAVVPARPTDAHELALSHDAEPGVFRLDHRSPSIQAHRSKALAKKSRSMTSSPTFAWSRLISSSCLRCPWPLPLLNVSFIPSSASRFHLAIMFGCTLYR